MWSITYLEVLMYPPFPRQKRKERKRNEQQEKEKQTVDKIEEVEIMCGWVGRQIVTRVFPV